MNDIDLARLARSLDQHPVHDGRCNRYCAPDIKRRYDDPDLMELTDAEEAAEAATWD